MYIILTLAAYCYANEDEVGEGLKEAFDSGVKREDIFVTTKLWGTYHARAEEGLDKSLKSLGLDYVDLFLMHWPVPMNPKGAYMYIDPTTKYLLTPPRKPRSVPYPSGRLSRH